VRREDVARAVADAVLEVPGVARLSPGSPVEVSTLFAGGKVVGVRLSGDVVEVHIVADRGPLPAVAEQTSIAAKRVLSASGDARDVLVVVDDVEESAVDRRART
jgi:hypothetical protein